METCAPSEADKDPELKEPASTTQTRRKRPADVSVQELKLSVTSELKESSSDAAETDDFEFTPPKRPLRIKRTRAAADQAAERLEQELSAPSAIFGLQNKKEDANRAEVCEKAGEGGVSEADTQVDNTSEAENVPEASGGQEDPTAKEQVAEGESKAVEEASPQAQKSPVMNEAADSHPKVSDSSPPRPTASPEARVQIAKLREESTPSRPAAEAQDNPPPEKPVNSPTTCNPSAPADGEVTCSGSPFARNCALPANVGAVENLVSTPFGQEQGENGASDEENAGGALCGQPVKRPSAFPGEEREQVAACCWACNLLKYDKQEKKFKALGMGVLRLLQEESGALSRLVFRQTGSWKVLLNSPANLVSAVEKTSTSRGHDLLKFSALVLGETQVLGAYCVKFPDANEREGFYRRLAPN